MPAVDANKIRWSEPPRPGCPSLRKGRITGLSRDVYGPFDFVIDHVVVENHHPTRSEKRQPVMAVLQHGTGMPAIDIQHIYGLVPPDYGIVRERDYGCNPVRYPSSGDIARKLIERRERGETVLLQVLPIAGVWVDGDLLAGGAKRSCARASSVVLRPRYEPISTIVVGRKSATMAKCISAELDENHP